MCRGAGIDGWAVGWRAEAGGRAWLRTKVGKVAPHRYNRGGASGQERLAASAQHGTGLSKVQGTSHGREEELQLQSAARTVAGAGGVGDLSDLAVGGVFQRHAGHALADGVGRRAAGLHIRQLGACSAARRSKDARSSRITHAAAVAALVGTHALQGSGTGWRAGGKEHKPPRKTEVQEAR